MDAPLSHRSAARTPSEPLLEVRGLRIHFRTGGLTVKAVDGISFSVGRGRALGLVGESGCGKSVTSLAVMGLIPQPPGIIAGGEIRLDGQDLLRIPRGDLRRIRGDRVAMIFQEPMTSLNPVHTVGDQIVEAIQAHRPVSHKEALGQALQLLQRVKIPGPEERLRQYPHNMSGGMRQRVMIAMALACSPQLLIADEPTTALDVTIQAQILDLLRELRAETDMAIMLITHDLGVVAEMADEVMVMYAGKVVEHAPVDRLFDAPQHPYTIGLLGSIPRLHDELPRLATIEGRVPAPFAMPEGCTFHPRCPFAAAQCRREDPILVEAGPGHTVSCWRHPLDIAQDRNSVGEPWPAGGSDDPKKGGS
jgi:oligopeptide/dipeptide ABC transporter ATP-binding protein